MAGPGIRYWEFANALSRRHDVTLATPNEPDVTSDRFAIDWYVDRGMERLVSTHDIVVAQWIPVAVALLARRHGLKIILDSYDPVLLENLEMYLGHNRAKLWTDLAPLKLSLIMADAVVCASDRQRDLWLGALMALGRITPDEYAYDASLRQLVDVVPFGIQAEDPRPTRTGFRQKLGMSPGDKVLIWGGGIWDWFDPLSLIEAMALISRSRSDVKLVFMGLKHPNEVVRQMEMASRAVELARRRGVLDRLVYFNYGWVPYNERQNHLLEADVGVSTHFDHAEARFSFRTRIVDYIWAELPIVATKGDAMAEVIAKHGLGVTVDYEDAAGLAHAITSLVDDRHRYESIKGKLAATKEQYRWEVVVEPIVRLIDAHTARPPRRLTPREVAAALAVLRYVLRHESEGRPAWTVALSAARTASKAASKGARILLASLARGADGRRGE